MARKPKTPYQEIQRGKAFAAVSRARRDGISITKAAKLEHTGVKNVRNWSTALTKQGSKWHVSAFDRAPRKTSYILPGELGGPRSVTATFEDSRTVSKINSYMGDVGLWGADKMGIDMLRRKWRGKSFMHNGRRIRFETSEEVLHEYFRTGEARDAMVGSG